jgi:O-antigen/teichoic acid export membrane protein
VRNTLLNAGGTFVGVAVSILLTPFLIHHLGADAYGVWALATTLTFGVGYLSFADLGLEQAAVRYIAEARSTGDTDRMNSIWASTFVLLSGIALVLTPPLVLLSGPLVDLFSVPASLHSEAHVAFAFVLAQLVFELPSRAFSALFEGVQRYGLWQLTRLTQGLLLAGLMVWAVLAGGGVGWLGIASFAGTAIAFLLGVALAFLLVPEVRVSRGLVNRKTIRQLVGFGGQLLIFRILSSIYRPMDKTIIGIALSTAAVTTYDVAFKIYTSAALVQSLATSALVPVAAYSREQPERLREMLLRGSNYTFAAAMPVATAAAVFAVPLIHTWIGPELLDAVTPTRLLLIALVPEFLLVVGQTMLVGLGVVRPMIWIVVLWTAINLTLSIVLVGPLEINGVIVATLTATMVNLMLMTRLILRELEVSLAEWVRDVVLPVLPGTAVQIAIGILLLPIARSSGSLIVVSALAGVTILIAIAVWFLCLSGRRRRELLQMIRETVGHHEAAEVPPAATIQPE